MQSFPKRVTITTPVLCLHLARCQRCKSSRCSEHPSRTQCWCRTDSLCTHHIPETCRKPVDTNPQPGRNLKDNRLKLSNQRETSLLDYTFLPRGLAPTHLLQKHLMTQLHAHSPVLAHHAVEGLPAGEVVVSAWLLIAFGWSGSVWKGGKSLNNRINAGRMRSAGTYEGPPPGRDEGWS